MRNRYAANVCRQMTTAVAAAWIHALCCERIISPIPRTAHRKLLILPLKLSRWLWFFIVLTGRRGIRPPSPPAPLPKAGEGSLRRRHSHLRRLLVELDHPPAGAGRRQAGVEDLLRLQGDLAPERVRLAGEGQLGELAEHVRFLRVRRGVAVLAHGHAPRVVLHVEIAAGDVEDGIGHLERHLAAVVGEHEVGDVDGSPWSR